MNGWSNYATWNANLWVENNEPLYRAKQRWEAQGVPWTRTRAAAFFYAEVGDRTPDCAPSRIKRDCSWREIAENWESGRLGNIASKAKREVA
jgi:hypothetical protein